MTMMVCGKQSRKINNHVNWRGIIGKKVKSVPLATGLHPLGGKELTCRINKKGIILAYGKKWDRKNHENDGFSRIPKIRDIKTKREKRIGLYILFNDRKIVYVGKSEACLRKRIRAHTKDKFKDQWDSFTWFITKSYYTSDLEALLHNIFYDIRAVTLNKIRAGFINAKKYS